jgi:hypothetical protein
MTYLTPVPVKPVPDGLPKVDFNPMGTDQPAGEVCPAFVS